jgi:saccharopine dehydrogenase-like NADP-dependent oxidoreductase
MKSVLVLGGYGVFGSRVCRLLARAPELRILVGGRNAAKAAAAAESIGPSAKGVVVDRDAPDTVSALLRSERPTVVIDAIGPFQGRDYRLAELVALHGAHSLDLADDRPYVTGIGTLKSRAETQGVLIVSGASTVPALSMAALDRLLEDLDSLESIDVGISPGHKSPRGISTVRSVLSYCGKQIPAVATAHLASRHGWGGLTRHRYPSPVGGRWLSNVDLPDIVLMPQRYPGVESVTLRAGLELSALHLGLSMLSALVARGTIQSLLPASRTFKAIADSLTPFGTDAGAMHVTVEGGRAGRRFRRHWAIVAEHNDGPFIPAAASSVLAKRLCGVGGYEPLTIRGAQPCVGLLRLEDFMRELAGLAIRTVMHDEPLDG